MAKVGIAAVWAFASPEERIEGEPVRGESAEESLRAPRGSLWSGVELSVDVADPTDADLGLTVQAGLSDDEDDWLLVEDDDATGEGLRPRGGRSEALSGPSLLTALRAYAA
jgi:hypothetical protein